MVLLARVHPHFSEWSQFPGKSCRKHCLVPVAEHQSLEQQRAACLSWEEGQSTVHLARRWRRRASASLTQGTEGKARSEPSAGHSGCPVF